MTGLSIMGKYRDHYLQHQRCKESQRSSNPGCPPMYEFLAQPASAWSCQGTTSNTGDLETAISCDVTQGF